ncbi:MAG: cytochrome c biogenesis protein ResB [Luteolibacter sp.]
MSHPQKKRGILAMPVAIFSSLRLTVVLLSLAMILIFVATLLQVKMGIHEVQLLYFQSWLAWLDVLPGEKKFSIPFPGGMLLGALLLLNLLAAHIRRFQLRWQKAGLILVHAGIILMLLGEFFTAIYSVESHMQLDEGETSNYSESSRETELALIQQTADGLETVHAIPSSRLKDGASFPFAGFELRIARFYRNSKIEDASAADTSFDPLRADRDIGAGLAVREKPHETAMDRRDLSTAFVEIHTPDGNSQGRWLLSNALPGKQEFLIGGTTWKMILRKKRYYHPFSIRLEEFTHEKYLGTEIPKNFSSRIRFINTETGKNIPALIYMNHPLRDEGHTFYQSGFVDSKGSDKQTSILQVVRNPAWTMPYVSCAMVGIGLIWIFLQHLIKAIRRRPSAA